MKLEIPYSLVSIFVSPYHNFSILEKTNANLWPIPLLCIQLSSLKSALVDINPGYVNFYTVCVTRVLVRKPLRCLLVALKLKREQKTSRHPTAPSFKTLHFALTLIRAQLEDAEKALALQATFHTAVWSYCFPSVIYFFSASLTSSFPVSFAVRLARALERNSLS